VSEVKISQYLRMVLLNMLAQGVKVVIQVTEFFLSFGILFVSRVLISTGKPGRAGRCHQHTEQNNLFLETFVSYLKTFL